MKKRVAYIGLSYPLLYDYGYQAERTINDLSDSPNPIIESPMGLMILYDEILFLCKSLCPNNMRGLPYVKYVDELYPDFYFSGILDSIKNMENPIIRDRSISYGDIVTALNVTRSKADSHTHSLKIGDINIAANADADRFLFDIFVFQALQQIYDSDIELISNRLFNMKPYSNSAETEFIDKIIIQGIPNYVGLDGPYHPCIEELRNNVYLTDFRKWIIQNHNNLQRPEIDEMCESVERNIQETKDNTFKKYLESNNGLSFFKSMGSTVIKTGLGLKFIPVSIIDAFGSIIKSGKETLDAKSLRWQGFIMDSRDIVKKIK